MHPMNLRQLRAFQVVGRLNSVTKAANELHIAQPALTRQLKELQNSVGVKLLQRQGRGIALTEAGAFLLERSTHLLHEYDRLVAEMLALRDHAKSRFSLGLPTAIAQLFGASLVAQIRDSEEIDLRLLDGWTGFIVEWLMHGRIDMGVVYDPLSGMPALTSELLAFEPLFLICAPDDPLAREASIRFKDAARLPLVTPSSNHALRVFLDAQFNAIGLTVNPIAEMDSMTALRTVVSKGAVYSIISEADAQSDGLIPLVTIPIAEPDLRRPIYLAWTRSVSNSPGGERCIEIIRRELHREIGGGRWNVVLP